MIVNKDSTIAECGAREEHAIASSSQFAPYEYRESCACIAITDDAFRIVSAGDMMVWLAGRPGANVLGMHLGDLMVCGGAPRTMVDQMMEATVQGGWHGNIAIKMVDGASRNLRVQMLPMRVSGKGVQYALVAYDTLARGIDADGIHGDWQWQMVFDSIEEGIMLVSLEHTIAAANSSLCVLLDVAPEQLIGQSCHSVLKGNDLPCTGCTADYMPCTSHMPTIKNQSELPDYLIFGTTAVDDIGNPLSRVLRFQQVVENRRAGMYLYEASRLVACSELAAGVAHNFGNVLMGISATLELLQMRSASEQPITDLAEMISGALGQVDKGAEIIQRLMSLAKNPASVVGPVDVSAIVDSAIVLCSAHPQAKRISLVNDVPDDLPRIMANEAQLTEVLVNLILNALQSSERGVIRTRVSVSADHIEINVTDEGSGIAPDDLERIFSPFFSKRRNGSTGTGLGLSCCMAQVSHMGGEIKVQSQLGLGSTFTVVLPKWQDEATISLAA